jgi:4-hydroxy-tetrahydrodipicolinate synthase
MTFKGLYTAIITPFNQAGEIDKASFKKLIQQQVEAGVDGIVVAGTTGESPTLTWEEHDSLIKLAVEIANKKIKVIAGAGSNCTAEAIEHSIKAEQAGADGLLQVNPYYNKPTQKGLFEHFSAIAESVNIPIMLYNIQGRCGVNLETPTLLELAKHPNIISVKEASGNLAQMKEVINSVPEDFTVLVGDDALCLEFSKLGGDGVVSVVSNIIPVEMKQFVADCLNKNWDSAQKTHNQLNNLFSDCFIEANPQPIKTLMADAGYCEPVFRLPMTTMLEENKEKLFQTWENYKNL